MKNAVTIHNVSRRAGVSLSTVSRVLNDHASVNAEMRERVLEAVKELGYRPNLAARTLKTNRSRLIVFLVPEISNPYYTETYRGIHSVVDGRGYITLIYETIDEKAAIQHILTRGADGVVFDSFYGKTSKERLIRSGVPFVRTNAPATPCTDESSVQVDVFGATLQVLSYLRAQGHERIGLIESDLGRGAMDERERAFRAYVTSREIEDPSPFIVRSVVPQEKYQGGYLGIRELVRRKLDLTAVVAHNDLVAVGAIAGARALGLTVPKDLSVVGFDNAAFAEYSNPALTTVNIPTFKQGEIAAKMLLELMDEPDEPRYCVQLQTELVLRDSVRYISS
jgi:LacI family transcriptional regulator